MALFIFMCFITGFNVIMNAVNHNYPALLGWLCALMWYVMYAVNAHPEYFQ